jgi:YjbR
MLWLMCLLRERDEKPMNTNDFRRLALALEGAEENSHMGSPDFRVGGHIFATLASASQGYGNLMLTPEQQAGFVEELPGIFFPVKGGWGRMGATHIHLAGASEDVLAGALKTAWTLRRERNAKSGRTKRAASQGKQTEKKPRKSR